MAPTEAPTPNFTFAEPPPGFFRGPAARVGAPSAVAESDPMLLHHLAHVSRAKLDNLFRSRKDSGLLKHVLIHNLSRSYEDLVPELVTEEREDGYDEIVIQRELERELQRRTAEEMWFDACLQDLGDEDDVEVEEVDDPMYVQQFYYPSDSTDDLSMADSPPALSPDMPSMDDSELDLEDDDADVDVDGLTSPSFMGLDVSQPDRASYMELRKREELAALRKRFSPARSERRVDGWPDVGEWVMAPFNSCN